MSLGPTVSLGPAAKTRLMEETSDVLLSNERRGQPSPHTFSKASPAGELGTEKVWWSAGG